MPGLEGADSHPSVLSLPSFLHDTREMSVQAVEGMWVSCMRSDASSCSRASARLRSAFNSPSRMAFWRTAVLISVWGEAISALSSALSLRPTTTCASAASFLTLSWFCCPPEATAPAVPPCLSVRPNTPSLADISVHHSTAAWRASMMAPRPIRVATNSRVPRFTQVAVQVRVALSHERPGTLVVRGSLWRLQGGSSGSALLMGVGLSEKSLGRSSRSC
mmetsp:Transcript_11152/g.32352  ORF Transcript_11152/g.32352 Transcript_11152/m.32352 type:complete len:219 (-) Transcript_11152:232-888(-)